MAYSSDRSIAVDREAQSSRFKTWIFFIVPIVAILFQIYVPLFFQFLGYLELPLLVTIYLALMRRSQIRGLFIGAAVGLAQDSLSKHPLGIYGICKTLVGYFAASLGLRIDVDQPFVRLLLTFVLFFFHEFLKWVLDRALLAQTYPYDWRETAILAALNSVVGVFLYHFLDRLREDR
jgi:rod shape-determining protein MreD